MATNTRLVTFNAQNVTPQDDGLLYETAIPQTGIIYGADLSANGTNTVHIDTGFGIVRGRFFEIFESDIAIPLSASGEIEGRIIGRLDLSNIDEPFVILAQTGTLAPLRQDADVNIFNGVHEFLLATFMVNEITISSFVDVKPIAMDLSPYALKHSPVFTGVPEAPTNENPRNTSKQIATNEFVHAAITSRIDMDTLFGLTASLTVPSGAGVAHTFDVETKLAGYYWGRVYVQWGASQNGRRNLNVYRMRGTTATHTLSRDDRMPVNGGIPTTVTIPITVYMAVGDKIRVDLFQNCGAALPAEVNVVLLGIRHS